MSAAQDITGENIRNSITADRSHLTQFLKPDGAAYEVYPDGDVVVTIRQNGVDHVFDIPDQAAEIDRLKAELAKVTAERNALRLNFLNMEATAETLKRVDISTNRPEKIEVYDDRCPSHWRREDCMRYETDEEYKARTGIDLASPQTARDLG